MKENICVVWALTVLLLCGINVAAQDPDSVSKKQKSGGSSRVVTKYDKSKDLTTVRLKEITITRLVQEKDVAYNIPLHQMNLGASFTYKGQQMTAPAQEVLIEFHAVVPNYLFMRGQQIIAALNREFPGEDKALVLGTTEYQSFPPKFNSVYEEIIRLKIPAEIFLRLAHAKSLELYVGPVAYKLSSEQKEYLSGLGDLLSPTPVNSQTAQ